MQHKQNKGKCSECNDGIIKNIARKKDMLCAFHLTIAYQKKTEENRQKKIDAGTIKVHKIANRSTKRANQEKEYLKKRAIFLKKPENLLCNANAPGCTKIAKVIHHKKGRIENLLTDERFWLATCSHCNMWIEENSEKAREMGLTLNRFEKK